MTQEELVEVENKINYIRILYSPILDKLIETLEEELAGLKSEVLFGKIRFVAEISDKSLFGTPEDPRFKSIESIAEKIDRKSYKIENFDKEMPDIFRTRIVCNYLSDVKKLAERIRKSQPLLQLFEIASDEDKIIEMRIKHPTEIKGIRCHVFIFKHKNSLDSPKIELQIMTMLQHAWDRKDHYLIYKPKGIEVSPEGRLKMEAMSALLYVADEFFDSIQKEVSIKGGL
jgi:ppGpp synthetase/RelA/SpoT-type nucleotidyltranferase